MTGSGYMGRHWLTTLLSQWMAREGSKLVGGAHQLMADGFLSTQKLPLRLTISIVGKCFSCILFSVYSAPWSEGEGRGSHKEHHHYTHTQRPAGHHTFHYLTHASTHTHTNTRTHAHTHACTHARTHAHTHARTHARTHTRTHARTHAPLRSCSSPLHLLS